MRKKRLMIAIACIILVGIAVIVFFSQQGKKPYKDLDAAQIVSAKVLLTPPDKTIEIENIQELVEYLNDVVVYNEDNSYTEYDWTRRCFYLDYGRRYTNRYYGV